MPRPRKYTRLNQETFDNALRLIEEGRPLSEIGELPFHKKTEEALRRWHILGSSGYSYLCAELDTLSNRLKMEQVSFKRRFGRCMGQELLPVPGVPDKQIVSQELLKFCSLGRGDSILPTEDCHTFGLLLINARDRFISLLAQQDKAALIAGQTMHRIKAPIELYCLEHKLLYSIEPGKFGEESKNGVRRNGCPSCRHEYTLSDPFRALNNPKESAVDAVIYVFDVDGLGLFHKIGYSTSPDKRLYNHNRRGFCFSLELNYASSFVTEQVLLARYRKRGYNLVPEFYHRDPMAAELRRRKDSGDRDCWSNLYHNGLGEVVRHPGGLQQIKRDIAAVLKDIAIHGPLSVCQEAVPKTKVLAGLPELEPPDRSRLSIPVIPLDMELIS